MTKKAERKRRVRTLLRSPKSRVRARRSKAAVVSKPRTYVTEQHWELW
jgi:hypothetical protein